MTPPTQERSGRFSRKVWLGIAAGAVLIAALVAVWVILDPLAGPFERLDEKRQTVTHPDGLVLRLAAGSKQALVQITTIPREEFLADQAGGDWQAAHKALPASLTPLSPLYTVKVKGQDNVVADMAIPNGADPLALVDLYRWDVSNHAWVFLPSTLDLAQQVIRFSPDGSSSTVMAVQVKPSAPAVAVVVSPGGPDLRAQYNLAMPEGINIDAQGQISGSPAQATNATVLPLIARRDEGTPTYSDPNQQTTQLNQLDQIARPYNGLVLDMDPGPGYTEFVKALADGIHAHNKRLEVVIRGVDLDNYDVPGLARSVDRIWLAPGDNPALYVPHGDAEAALDALVRLFDRSRVGLLVSGLSADVSAKDAHSIDTREALAAFGAVEPESGYSADLTPGDNLAVRLSGQVTSMSYDDAFGMNYMTYVSPDGQEHHIYFASPLGLERKLALAGVYGVGAVAVYGLAHPDAPDHLADGVSGFLASQPVNKPEPNSLAWTVAGPDGGQVAAQNGDLSLLQYLWQAVTNPGQYVVSAALSNQSTLQPIGTLEVNVAQVTQPPAATPTPTPTARPAGTPRPPVASQPVPTVQAVTGSIVAGTFELGGQVNGSIQHPDLMTYSGMTWVKYQHKWNLGEPPSVTADNINEAKSKGFKVLMSIPGPEHPSSIDYASYASFVGGVAALGADGIEVWNEMNLDREWPASDINGASYVTNMLAPAYAAIKAANPATMVISGAPSPSGAFGGCGVVQLPDGTSRAGCDDWFYIKQMAQAGAVSYADCMGVHFNAGATSPSAATGHPNDDGSHHYSWYYQPMVSLYYGTFGKPLCFTELGYASTQGSSGSPAFPWADKVTVAQQAQWLAETAVLASQSNKVRLMVIWNVDFSGGEGGDPMGAYAMVRSGGSCPACDALHAVHP